MKKVLSLVLVIAMVLSSMSFAFAAPKFEDVAGDYEEAVGVLTALGVVTGYEDGTYRPERVVTRAEMAKLIVEILGYGDLVAGSKSNFSDTQGHWADAWIALAAGRGLVVGTGDGKFTPDRQVSYDEAITMVVRALGYTDNSNELKGMTWPTNFKVKAAELKLLNKVKSVAGGADRGGVAQLLFNALNATLVTVTTDGDVTALFDTVEDKKEERLLLSRLAGKKPLTVNADYVDPDHKNYKGNVVDLTPYMYQDITVYEKDGVVVYVKGVDSLVLKGTVDTHDEEEDIFEVEDAKEDVYTMLVGNTKNENIADNTPVLLNGEEVDFEDVVNLEGAEVTVVLKGAEGDKISKTVAQEVVGIVAKLATVTVQAEEDYKAGEVEILAFNDDVVLPVASKKVDFDRLVVKGAVDTVEDIEEDDVLTLYYGKGLIDDDVKLEIVVSRDTVEGKVTRITVDSDGALSKIFVDGKSYSLNDDFDDEITVKDEGTFFLDFEGKIFSAETESDVTPANYALVLSVTNGYITQNEAEDDIVLRDAKVKVLTAKGETVTYVLDHEALLKVNEKIVDKKLVVKVSEGSVIEYKLNKDKEIKEAVDYTAKLNFDDEVKTTVNSFKLAKDAALFGAPKYADAKDTDGAKVIAVADLDKEIDGYFLKLDGEITVIVVTKGAGVEEKIYGMITANSSTTTDDDGEEVVLYTAYVDGKKVEYLGLADEDKITDLNKFGELTLSSGSLEKITAIDVVTGTAVKGRVTTSIKDADNGEVYYLADDVVVYVLTSKGKFDKVGSKSDISGKDFWLYDTVDDDLDYDVVVVKPVELK